MKTSTLGISQALAICVVLPIAVVHAEDALDRAEARARELCARMTRIIAPISLRQTMFV